MPVENPFAALLNAIPWTPVDPPLPEVVEADDDLPHVTHEGYLTIGAARLRVFQLSDGQRIIDTNDMDALFSSGGPTA
jgi:hypothetical protein